MCRTDLLLPCLYCSSQHSRLFATSAGPHSSSQCLAYKAANASNLTLVERSIRCQDRLLLISWQICKPFTVTERLCIALQDCGADSGIAHCVVHLPPLNLYEHATMSTCTHVTGFQGATNLQLLLACWATGNSYAICRGDASGQSRQQLCTRSPPTDIVELTFAIPWRVQTPTCMLAKQACKHCEFIETT